MSERTYPDPRNEPPEGRQERAANPLHVSLGQLLGWTAGTCAALVLMKPSPVASVFNSSANLHDESSLVAEQIIAVASAPMYGVALFKLGESFWHWAITRQPKPREPGHWLLMMTSTAFLTVALVRMANVFAVPTAAIPAMLTFFLTFVFMLQAHYELHPLSRWKLVFQYLPWFVLVGVVGCCSRPPVLSFIAIAAFLASTIYAATDDVKRRHIRDLLHWLGILVPLGVLIYFAALGAVRAAGLSDYSCCDLALGSEQASGRVP